MKNKVTYGILRNGFFFYLNDNKLKYVDLLINGGKSYYYSSSDGIKMMLNIGLYNYIYVREEDI